jgi:hypothetical protein
VSIRTYTQGQPIVLCCDKFTTIRPRHNPRAQLQSPRLLRRQLHSDRLDALMKLKERAFVSLRLLCVSSTPSSFIDLTNREDMESFLDEHRIDNGRIYKTELLTRAQHDGWLVQPKAWDIIVFDAQTPHRPRGALLPHQRVLQQASIGLQLPVGWRERVKSGDAPKFQPC